MKKTQDMQTTKLATIWAEVVRAVYGPAEEKRQAAQQATYKDLHGRLGECSHVQPRQHREKLQQDLHNDPTNPEKWEAFKNRYSSEKELIQRNRELRSAAKNAIRAYAEKEVAPFIQPLAERMIANINRVRASIESRPEVVKLAGEYGIGCDELAAPIIQKLSWAENYLQGIVSQCKTGMVTPDALDEIVKLAKQ